tara:strand:- start:96 stop:302 length:207 start_codon:yes stop_codon:yes gene_type:complete
MHVKLLYFIIFSLIASKSEVMALEIQQEDKIKSEKSKPESELKPIPDNTFKSTEELSEDVPVSLPKDI